MSQARIIQELAGFCRNNPIAKKLVLVQNSYSGQLILQSLARCTGGWVNLHAITPLVLAWDIIGPEVAMKELIAADAAQIEGIVLTAYNKIQRSYFPADPPLGLISALAQTISELRIAQVLLTDLEQNGKIHPAKARDLAEIMKGYLAELGRNALLDAAAIYELAIQKALPTGTFLLMPSSFQAAGLCREFLLKIGGEGIVVLNEDPVLGIPQPASCFAASGTEPENLLSCIFDPSCCNEVKAKSDSRLPHSKIELFAAMGMRNEVREVYRRLIEQKIPYDEVELILPEYATYAPALKDIAEEIGNIHLTFGLGLPPFRSRPARCLSAFAEWISNGFPEPLLRSMFANGLLCPWDEISGRQTARVLRSAQIGWGKQRYSACLETFCNVIREDLGGCEDEEERGAFQQRLDRAEKVRDRLGAIIDSLPSEDDSPEQYFKAAIAFMENHAQISSESEGRILNSLLTALKSNAVGFEQISSMRDLCQRLQAIAGSINVDISGPTPGCIHVIPFAAGGISGRSHTYILGLSEATFPGTITGDPILTDEDRQNLSAQLGVSHEAARERAFQIGQAFARIRGHLCLSYSTQGLADGSQIFPSPLLLQAYRLSSGNLAAGYKDLENALGKPAGFIADQRPLGVNEWWLSRVFTGGILNDTHESVLNSFPDLRSGQAAASERRHDYSGEFDGKLRGELDFDLQKSKRAISATALENYAKCPRSFFFSHMLRIAAPEDVTFEPGQWLDNLQRGSLLHDFYCRFLSELKSKKEKRDASRHQERAAQALDEVIAEWKEQIPPPSGIVFESERSELHRSIGIFLCEEEQASAFVPGTPEYFEISFGSSESEIAVPIEIKLSGGKSVHLRGRIDRIDRLHKPGTWAVWDYKTGRSTDYKSSQYTAGGKQLQHVLYACAAEQILAARGEKNPTVAVSGYLFTTERSDGNVCVPRDTKQRSEGLAAIKELLDAMADGVFLGTGANCGYCDWSPCCHSNEAERWKELAEKNDAAVERIQKVQQYE